VSSSRPHNLPGRTCQPTTDLMWRHGVNVRNRGKFTCGRTSTSSILFNLRPCYFCSISVVDIILESLSTSISNRQHLVWCYNQAHSMLAISVRLSLLQHVPWWEDTNMILRHLHLSCRLARSPTSSRTLQSPESRRLEAIVCPSIKRINMSSEIPPTLFTIVPPRLCSAKMIGRLLVCSDIGPHH
jgi:hypothetical protein